MGRKQSLSSLSQRGPPTLGGIQSHTHSQIHEDHVSLSVRVSLSLRYTYQVKIGARTFPRSSSSKKEARDTAVQAALAILIDEEKESETGPTSQVHTHTHIFSEYTPFDSAL